MAIHEITGRLGGGEQDIVWGRDIAWFLPEHLTGPDAVAKRWLALKAMHPGSNPEHVLLEDESKTHAGNHIWPLSTLQASTPKVARSFRMWQKTTIMVRATLGYDIQIGISGFPPPYLGGMYKTLTPARRWGYTAPMAAATAAQVRLVKESGTSNAPLVDWICPYVYTESDDPAKTLAMARWMLAEARGFGVPIIPAIMPQIMSKAAEFPWLKAPAWDVLQAEASAFPDAVLYVTDRAEREPWPLLESMRGRFGIEAVV